MSDTVHRTERWVGVSALAFGAAAFGAGFRLPAAFLLAVVGVGYATAARAGSAPDVEVALERTLDEDAPEPGDSVTVTLEVTNAGERTLPDLRVVDGVPRTLDVADGSPRLGTALPPGESATVEYDIEARRGEHAFEPVRIAARDWLGTTERETERLTHTELTCVPELEALASFPLRSQATDYAGRVTTDTAGSGVEFHSTRQYRRGDPIARIDWARVAKTGDMTTVDFREERAAETVVVLDTRADAHVADADNESAIDYGVAAGSAVASASLDTSNRVGLAAFGPRWEWISPGLGRTHRVRLREALALSPAMAPTRPPEQFRPLVAFRRLRERLPADAQVVFVSPLVDSYALTVARRLETRGYAVTLLSPDVTDTSTPGRALARLERRRRLTAARAVNIRVVDWDPGTALPVALERASRRWRQ